MTQKTCPIVWTKEDGPCPCAFRDRHNQCESRTDCLEMYEERYRQDLLDAATLGIALCPQCKTNIVTTTLGDMRRGWAPLCPTCSRDYQEGQDLAAHIRGDI